MPPPAVILAGGRARRMGGGDKCLMPLGGQPLLDHILARVTPQAGPVALNANGAPERFAHYGLPVISDEKDDRGPLAGVLAALNWARGIGADRVITLPADTPFLPQDLVPRLLLAQEPRPDRPAIAISAGRRHPVVGIWPTELAQDLSRALDQGTRRMSDWVDRLDPGLAEFPATQLDPFYNINRPEDLRRAEELSGART
ncbi:molybdenum cofactor guanylyltransferase MobA [Pseudooceanicola sp. C21-150M6]|uniref:molybdenum cofactor guanylyltransferase MobA n=1 Tax=Pseudooceanicola sp. C21-150M6 TaxID=3434355 RepID=UPI003D8001B2